eukprot:TRINITY_DN681_c0_g1_i1.p1 TRINITY_DN681_c0_g1~~TRINITY_DN681_c0_g1_i1.p1  ORF type:complete len:543 (-),score=87.34 TRINITY_DN681_c0_g1_i1:59-1687(-)
MELLRTEAEIAEHKRRNRATYAVWEGESYLTCPQCLDLLQDPTTLPGCLHTFCGKHLAAENGEVKCPLCNHKSKCETPAEFRNVILAAELRSLEQGETAECAWCETNPATLFCPDCDYNLCEECSTMVHAKKVNKTHGNVRPLHEALAIKVFRCTIEGHEAHDADFFDTELGQAVCIMCLQSGKHKNESCLPFAGAEESLRSHVEKFSEDLERHRSQLQEALHAVHNSVQLLTESYERALDTIHQEFDSCRAHLDESEAQMQALLQERKQAVDQQLREAHIVLLAQLERANKTAARRSNLTPGELVQANNLVPAAVLPRVPVASLHVSEPSRELAIPEFQVELMVENDDAKSEATEKALPSLTFTTEEGVVVRSKRSGTTLLCKGASAKAPAKKAGKAKLVKTVASQAATDHYFIQAVEKISPELCTWKVRLDNAKYIMAGVVSAEEEDKLESPPWKGKAFLWQVNFCTTNGGKLGQITPAVINHPQVPDGTVITFHFNLEKGTLSVARNRREPVEIGTGITGSVRPAFVLQPNERITILHT